MKGSHLRALVPDTAPAAPPDRPALEENRGRGRLLYVPDVTNDLLRGSQTMTWVTRNFAPEHRLKIGRRPAWWERDALAWIDQQRDRRG